MATVTSVQNHSPADPYPELEVAFAAWQEARSQLGRLQVLGGGVKPGQFAASPEVLAHFESLRKQEEICERLWVQVTTVAEGRATRLESKRMEPAPRQVQEGAQEGRRAFEAWTAAEREAQAVERDLLAIMQLEIPTPELLHSAHSKRVKAQSLLEAAVREMKDRVASLHHRKILGPASPPTE